MIAISLIKWWHVPVVKHSYNNFETKHQVCKYVFYCDPFFWCSRYLAIVYQHTLHWFHFTFRINIDHFCVILDVLLTMTTHVFDQVMRRRWESTWSWWRQLENFHRTVRRMELKSGIHWNRSSRKSFRTFSGENSFFYEHWKFW